MKAFVYNSQKKNTFLSKSLTNISKHKIFFKREPTKKYLTSFFILQQHIFSNQNLKIVFKTIYYQT